MRESIEAFAENRDQIDPELLLDLTLIGSVAGLLILIHVLAPAHLQAELAFNHEKFRLWTLVTSAYVHADSNHLVNNVTGFLLTAVIVYWLTWLVQQRRWFRVTTGVFLVGLPVLVNLTSYLILSWLAPEASFTGRGFSGIGAGYVGYLYVALLVWIGDKASETVSNYIGQAIFVLIVWELSLIYSGPTLWVVGLVIVCLSLLAWGLLRQTEIDDTRAWWADWQPEIGLGIGFVAVILAAIVSLFPANFIGPDSLTNIFAHGAGFLWGLLIALLFSPFSQRYT